MYHFWTHFLVLVVHLLLTLVIIVYPGGVSVPFLAAVAGRGCTLIVTLVIAYPGGVLVPFLATFLGRGWAFM